MCSSSIIIGGEVAQGNHVMSWELFSWSSRSPASNQPQVLPMGTLLGGIYPAMEHIF